MARIYTPTDIIWIKNVTNTVDGEAYLNLPGNEFVLHFPARHKGNVLSPAIDELILIYQRVRGIQAFTHLVTPVDNLRSEEMDRPDFPYGRRVKIIAKGDRDNFIHTTSTLWDRLNFAGFTQGNACKIDNISDIGNSNELRLDIWQRFDAYFVLTERQSAITTSALIDELGTSNPDLKVTEGGLNLVTHLVRERNKKIIDEKKQQAINNNSLKCEVCDFSFSKIYNANFIECHHIIPISAPGRIKETSLADISLVCPNCHRMLHTKFDGQFLSIKQLQDRMILLTNN